MRTVVVFDVNETLLDLQALDSIFLELFGDAQIRRMWFGLMLQSAFVSTITGDYHNFGEIGVAALDELARAREIRLENEERQLLVAGMQHLPPHSEVPAALQTLRDAGFYCASLTNSTQQVSDAQLSNSGLDTLLEASFSVDAVSRLKPAPEPYRMTASMLGVDIGQIRMVAAHGWDIAGAAAAGCRTAFVSRPGQFLDPVAPAPEIVAPDLLTIAKQIIERDSPF